MSSQFSKDQFYSISQLPQVLGTSFNTVLNRVAKGELKPDYIAPLTGKKYFLKENIESKYLTGCLQRA